VERVQAASRRLADATAAQVEGLWARVDAGALSVPAFRAAASAVVARANARGVALADIGLTAEVMRQLGRRAVPLGLTPTAVQVDQSRMRADIDRVLDRHGDPADSPVAGLGDWARSEPLLTVATAVQAGLVARRVGGWTRQLAGTSCARCTAWADGVVRSAGTRMARHKGCDCIQQPVFSGATPA